MVAGAKSNLIIRADANAEIGTGHLMRCFALAQSWKAAGGKVVFITNCKSSNLIERLKNENFEVVEIENSYPHLADWLATQAVLKNYPKAWCAVDGYHFDAKFHGLIRRNGNRVLVVDDTAHLDFYDADAILNQNINADELNYNCPPETQLLLGTQYVMLRQEFLARRDWQREIPEIARKILITMGGGDFHNQTLKAIRAVEQLKVENLQVKAIIGASNPHFAGLQKAVENSSVHIELIVGAENMSELMAWADICVSAAGSTCWETAFMHLPSVLIVTAENQTGIADGLDNRNFAVNLGWFEQVSETDLSKNSSEILLDKKRRREMSEAGREIVNGSGVARLVEFLSENP